jgi:hypothetical protein
MVRLVAGLAPKARRVHAWWIVARRAGQADVGVHLMSEIAPRQLHDARRRTVGSLVARLTRRRPGTGVVARVAGRPIREHRFAMLVEARMTGRTRESGPCYVRLVVERSPVERNGHSLRAQVTLQTRVAGDRQTEIDFRHRVRQRANLHGVANETERGTEQFIGVIDVMRASGRSHELHILLSQLQ